MKSTIGKSIVAILVGLVTIMVTHTGTDALLESLGVFPTYPEPFNVPWMVALATFYRAVFSTVGCYLTASLAPNRPMKHALILGYIGVVLSTMGLLAVYGSDTEFSRVARQTPAWYTVGLIVMAIPCAWLGAKLKLMRKPNTQAV